jgi:CRISPR-associated endonuclease/helicase Cas3
MRERIDNFTYKQSIAKELYFRIIRVDFGDCRKIYGHGTDSRTRLILQNKSEIEEANYKQLVDGYFSEMSERDTTDFSYSKEIFRAMENLRYHDPSDNSTGQKTVSDFQIIEKKKDGMSVFIESPDDQQGIKAREAYQELMDQKVSKPEFDKLFKRVFNQRIITVPKYSEKMSELKGEARLNVNLLWVKQESFAHYYDLETGFIRSRTPEGETLIF